MGAHTGPAGSAAMDPGSTTASAVDLTDISTVEVAAPGAAPVSSTSPSSNIEALGLRAFDLV